MGCGTTRRGRMILGLALVVALAAVSIVASARPTEAATDHLSGTLWAGDPTMKLIQPNLNQCGSVLAVDVHFDEVYFDAPVSGNFEFSITVGGESTAMYLYQGTSNCVRASNGTPPQFHANLTAGEQYRLVIVDATEAQVGGAWTVEVIYPDGGLGGPPPTPPTPPDPSDPTPGTTVPAADAAAAVVLNPTFTG